jgi:hypothetical protein
VTFTDKSIFNSVFRLQKERALAVEKERQKKSEMEQMQQQRQIKQSMELPSDGRRLSGCAHVNLKEATE